MHLLDLFAWVVVGAWSIGRTLLVSMRFLAKLKPRDVLVRACVVCSASWLIFRVLVNGLPLVP